MAGEAGLPTVIDQTFRVAVSLESLEAPAAGRWVVCIVLDHDAHQYTVTFCRCLVLCLVLEQIKGQNGTIVGLP